MAIVAVLLAAAAAGWVWAAIAAYLRVRRGTSEIITTLLLNFVGLALVLLMVHEPALLRQPVTSSETLPQSAPLSDPAQLPLLGIERSPATIALWIAVIGVICVGWCCGTPLSASGSGRSG
ncbi:branched-chain amino acid transport system / permease component family protein [Rhodococcus sp. MTM3W5.2]|nr:branched-chain amino acid transport system / permease component family protein [Rhodococcus sp. MTM3W5.2]